VKDVQPRPADSQLIDLLNKRDGQQTMLMLRDGRRLDVRNIAWGYDMGDEFAHVTTNCSPHIDGLPLDVFFTNEVRAVTGECGVILYGEGQDVRAEVAAYFAARGMGVQVSPKDYSQQVRSGPWRRKSSTGDHHVWVDLIATDGQVLQGGYGSGDSEEQALLRAQQRYRQEQEGGPVSGPRRLP